MRSIYGYYHVCMINHWAEIVQEQIALIVDSGLYSQVRSIYIGCLGSKQDLGKLDTMISCLPKFHIAYHSENIKEFEFPTLNLMKDHADRSDSFDAFYFHTKAVSWPKGVDRKGKDAFIGGEYWRHHLNYWNLKKWELCHYKLKTWDTCGVKLIEESQGPAYQKHYSGTFFWARSEYLKSLPPVVYSTDRYQAEFWIGKNPNMLAATLNQDWVDYNTQKIWVDPEDGGPVDLNPPMPEIRDAKETPYGIQITLKNRNIVHTLAYNLYSEVEKAVSDLYQQNHHGDFQHLIVDLEFPLEEGDKVPEDIERAISNNSIKLMDLATRFGSRYVRFKNQGVSQNWNQVIKFMNVGDGDVLIGADPDERPQTDGWVKAMGSVMRSVPSYGVVCLLQPEQLLTALAKSTHHDIYTTQKISVLDIHGSMSWAQIGVSGKLISEIGEIPVPKEYSIYGGIEGALLAEMQARGYKWCMLRDHLVRHDAQWDSVLLLRQWKHWIIDNCKNTQQVTFEDWLKEYQKGNIQVRTQ